jgi:hypothetical protein
MLWGKGIFVKLLFRLKAQISFLLYGWFAPRSNSQKSKNLKVGGPSGLPLAGWGFSIPLCRRRSRGPHEAPPLRFVGWLRAGSIATVAHITNSPIPVRVVRANPRLPLTLCLGFLCLGVSVVCFSFFPNREKILVTNVTCTPAIPLASSPSPPHPQNWRPFAEPQRSSTFLARADKRTGFGFWFLALGLLLIAYG